MRPRSIPYSDVEFRSLLLDHAPSLRDEDLEGVPPPLMAEVTRAWWEFLSWSSGAFLNSRIRSILRTNSETPSWQRALEKAGAEDDPHSLAAFVELKASFRGYLVHVPKGSEVERLATYDEFASAWKVLYEHAQGFLALRQTPISVSRVAELVCDASSVFQAYVDACSPVRRTLFDLSGSGSIEETIEKTERQIEKLAAAGESAGSNDEKKLARLRTRLSKLRALDAPVLNQVRAELNEWLQSFARFGIDTASGEERRLLTKSLGRDHGEAEALTDKLLDRQGWCSLTRRHLVYRLLYELQQEHLEQEQGENGDRGVWISPRRHFERWLSTVAQFWLYDVLRPIKQDSEADPFSERDSSTLAGSEDESEDVRSEEQERDLPEEVLDAIRELLEQMDEDDAPYGRILFLSYVLGLTDAEVADELGLYKTRGEKGAPNRKKLSELKREALRRLGVLIAEDERLGLAFGMKYQGWKRRTVGDLDVLSLDLVHVEVESRGRLVALAAGLTAKDETRRQLVVDGYLLPIGLVSGGSNNTPAASGAGDSGAWAAAWRSLFDKLSKRHRVRSAQLAVFDGHPLNSEDLDLWIADHAGGSPVPLPGWEGHEALLQAAKGIGAVWQYDLTRLSEHLCYVGIDGFKPGKTPKGDLQRSQKDVLYALRNLNPEPQKPEKVLTTDRKMDPAAEWMAEAYATPATAYARVPLTLNKSTLTETYLEWAADQLRVETFPTEDDLRERMNALLMGEHTYLELMGGKATNI